jgi:hypothetical protein
LIEEIPVEGASLGEPGTGLRGSLNGQAIPSILVSKIEDEIAYRPCYSKPDRATKSSNKQKLFDPDSNNDGKNFTSIIQNAILAENYLANRQISTKNSVARKQQTSKDKTNRWLEDQFKKNPSISHPYFQAFIKKDFSDIKNQQEQ